MLTDSTLFRNPSGITRELLQAVRIEQLESQYPSNAGTGRPAR